ncbi:MAG: ATP-binding protein [Magnetospirillum sp.]|nr:ATP-binding protein [Magnetospirillum sp.]
MPSRASANSIWRSLGSLGADTRLVSIAGKRFVTQSQPVPGEDWRIQYFTDWDTVLVTVRSKALIAGSAWAVLLLLLLYIRQRRLGIRARAEAQAAVEETLRHARDELERTVAARTAALTAEVAERQKTERHLRETQDELIHAGKMAALGQMSAAMAHEINQPLTALRTFLSSTRLFVDRDNREAASANFDMMNDLAERIAKITQHLKVFARKSPISFQTVDLSQSVERSLLLLDGQVRLAGVEVAKRLEPVPVAGDPLRLEQVFVNLFRNAIDAMRAVEVRRLEVVVAREGESCVARIADTGPGIDAEVMERLFEPFFTTKEVGEGLGLGLSLSYGIIRDMGGTIHAESLAPSGAAFVIRLPLAAAKEEEGSGG